MKKKINKKHKFLLFLIISKLIFSNIFSMETEVTQPQEPRVPLKVLDAIYGVPDINIRSGTNIILRNKETKDCIRVVKGDLQIEVGRQVKSKAEASRINNHEEKAELTPNFVFKIEKIGGQEGEIIKYGDAVTLKSLADFAQQTPYLGLKKAAGWAMGRGMKKLWFAYLDSLKSDPICQWIIEGPKKEYSKEGKIVENGGLIALKNSKEQRYIYDTKYAEDKLPLTENVDNRSLFYNFMILPEEFGEFNIGVPLNQKFQTKTAKDILITDLLNGEIKNKQGLTTIEDGITFQGNFNDFLGDLGLTAPLSRIFKELKVTYLLGRNKYTESFLDASQKIQIPTQAQLELAKKELNVIIEEEKDLAQMGLNKVSGRLVCVATNGGISYGINDTQKLFEWDGEKFNPINTGNLRFIKVAIGNDATILLIGTDYNLYKKTSKGFNKLSENKFLDISLANQNDIWVIASDSKAYKFNIQNGQLTPVGQKLFKQISVGVDGTTFAINQAGEVFRWMGGTNYQSDESWIQIPGVNLKQIIVANKNEIWGIDIDSRRTFQLKNNSWKEIGAARHINYLAISGAGEMWALVPEVPSLPGGNAVFHKVKNVITFNMPIALKAFYQKYITIGEGGNLTASTNWPESLVFINPQNEAMRGSVAFSRNVVLKFSSTNTYAKVTTNEQGNITINANEKNIQNATIFALTNELKPEDTSELEKDIDTPILLKSAEGFLAAKKQTGEVFISAEQGLLSRWRIESIK